MKTFEEVAASYVKYGGSKEFLNKPTEHFRGRLIHTISAFNIIEMANELYPWQSGATKNRQAVTPVSAVLRHAVFMGLIREVVIKRFREDKIKRKNPANDAWMWQFVRQADKDDLPHVAAIALFMNHTAARVTEAVNLLGEHVDLARRTALLIKTKTDTDSLRYLTEDLVSRMTKLDLGLGKRVFSYSCRWSVNDRIKAVCERAGIDYKSSHALGRHSFATNALNLGIGVKAAMDAGGWKSSVVFLETYVHTKNAGRMVANRIDEARDQTGYHFS